MLYSFPNRPCFARSFFSLAMSFAFLLSLTACNKQATTASEQAAPRTFASPAEASDALADAAKCAKSG